MVEAALLADYLCNYQPLPVRSRLLHDKEFGERFGLVPRHIVTLGADVHIDRQQLFSAIRRAFANQQAASLSDIDGHDVLVKIDQGQVILELPYSARRAQI